ncbi:MAG: twin-arginine translocase subunit TatC [Planctomycetota bacterium]
MRRLPDNPDQYKMSLGEHLDELRRRLIYALVGVGAAAVLCMVFGGRIVRVVIGPVREAAGALAREGSTGMIVLTPLEPFMITLKTSLVVGLVLSSPWVLYQVWLFVAAGLYRHERRVIYVFVPFSAVLFVAGTVFAYFVAIRYGLRFLLPYGGFLGTIADAAIPLSAAVSFVMTISVAMGAVFQLPLVMLVLAKVGIASTALYMTHWRYAMAAVFAVAAVLTPPDVLTQLAMAGPMIGLYWLGVLLSKTFAGRSTDS